MEFGLYAWQPDGSVDRKLKEGAKTLVGAVLVVHVTWMGASVVNERWTSTTVQMCVTMGCMGYSPLPP
jgi:hypothetical protein